MKKIILLGIAVPIVCIALYYAFIYYVPYSEGIRSGELIKISNKGIVAKTWEGEISQGVSEAQIFAFSVLDKDKEVIEQLKKHQGKQVKLTYIERYNTFFWLGDTKYFITKVSLE